MRRPTAASGVLVAAYFRTGLCELGVCVQFTPAAPGPPAARHGVCREDLNQRMPGYQVAMGFGLHVGWAIEGAIGSEYKIDASYLSPHVNMASRLEAATKQYGASILLSDDFVRMLSPEVRALVRQVDCVTVKGSNQPVGLFTYDVDCEGMDSLRLSQLKPVSVARWRRCVHWNSALPKMAC